MDQNTTNNESAPSRPPTTKEKVIVIHPSQKGIQQMPNYFRLQRWSHNIRQPGLSCCNYVSPQPNHFVY